MGFGNFSKMKKTTVKIKKWVFPILQFISSWVYFRLKTNKKNRTLLIAQFGKFGGTRTYFISLLNFLAQQDKDVIVGLYPEQKEKEILQLLKKYHFSYFIIDYDFGHISFQQKIFSKFNINPAKQTIHALNYYLKLLIKYECNHVIVSVGTAEKYLYFFLLPIQLKYIIHTVVEHKLELIRKYWLKFNHHKQIITVSDFSKKAIQQYWQLNKNISYVYNYYEKQNDYTRLKINKKQITILTVGSVEWYKNPEFWIEIAEKLTNMYSHIEFFWIGDGSLFDFYRQKVSQNKQINFTGFKSNIESWYQKANIYFQPSLKESFGISVIGAMANSIPCIVSNKEGLPEVIKDKKTGFIVDCANKQEIIELFSRLIKEPALRISIGKAAKMDYLNRFNHKIWYNNMIKNLE